MTVFQLKKTFPLILMVFISCHNNSATEASSGDSVSIAKPKVREDSVTPTPKRNHLGKIFHRSEPFDVISFNKGVTLEYTGPDDTTECKKWKIRKEHLLRIFKNSEPIGGTTWDLAFAFTTCVVNGQVNQKGELFEYSLNAGSWFSITCRDTSLLFGDFNKKDKEFFLESADLH